MRRGALLKGPLAGWRGFSGKREEEGRQRCAYLKACGTRWRRLARASEWSIIVRERAGWGQPERRGWRRCVVVIVSPSFDLLLLEPPRGFTENSVPLSVFQKTSKDYSGERKTFLKSHYFFFLDLRGQRIIASLLVTQFQHKPLCHHVWITARLVSQQLASLSEFQFPSKVHWRVLHCSHTLRINGFHIVHSIVNMF